MRDTIEMARESGFERVIGVNQKTGIQTIEVYAKDSLQRFEALVRADEREACAKVCEQVHEDFGGPDEWDWHSKDYARAIRARGNE